MSRQNTVIKQDPAVLAAMAKTFADQMATTTEARAQAEAKADELATKLGFTKAAVHLLWAQHDRQLPRFADEW